MSGDARRDRPTGHLQRVDVLGVKVSAIDMSDAINAISEWVATGEKKYVCVSNVHSIMECQRDDSLLRIHNQSGLTTPDGMPLVWSGRRAGAWWMSRVYGPDLLLEVMNSPQLASARHFFHGSTPDTVEAMVKNLEARYPHMAVAGWHAPPFRALTPREVDETVDRINQATPDIVWVGLGCPKQERWMAEFRPSLSAPVLVGVGAAFDFIAGTVSQAPGWMQRAGLEWLYRLLMEPRRLTARYVRTNPAFVWRILANPPHLIDEVTLPES